MATDLATIIADFQTQLATAIAIAGTSATLQSATDDDGVALPTGRYFFTIDGDNSNKEHIVCDLASTALTNIKTVSRQGVETAGVLRKHRVGATVTITDFKHIQAHNDLLSGDVGFDSATKIGYDADPAISSGDLTKFATVKYVNDTAIAGAPDAGASTKGVTKLSVAPVSPTNPIAVGDNDGRVPTQAENDSLAGPAGTPSSTNVVENRADTSNGATITAATIAFVNSNPDTITDSGNGFVTAGFRAGQLITVTGSASNNATFEIASVAAGTITLISTDALVAESAGATVTIAVATANRVVRYKSDSNIKVPSTPTASTDAASKNYVDSGLGNIDTSSYVLGESFTGATTPQAAYVVNDLWQWGQNYLSSTSQCSFGQTSGNIEQRALKIVPKRNVTIASIRMSLIKIGTPTDNVSVEIQTDTAGSPSGTPVTNGTSSTVAGGTLSATAFSESILTFATPPALVAGTTYWVVFKRSSTLDNSNYFATSALNYDLAYGSFAGKSYLSSAWSGTTSNGNLPHLELTPATGSSLSLWKTDSDSSLWIARQFYGFCTTTGSANADATLVRFGKLGGFASLTIGTDYTTSTTAGGYSATAGGTYVGTAVSATELDIPRIKYGNGTQASAEGGAMISGMALPGNPTTPACYKLPFNAIFVYSSDASSGVANGQIYAHNSFGAGTLVARILDQTSGEDGSLTFPYTRGTYFYPLLSSTNQNWTVSCTPIIE